MVKSIVSGYKPDLFTKATNKEGIGDIDFVWGDKSKGLQHIIERRNSEGIDGIQFVRDLPNFMNSSKVYKKSFACSAKLFYLSSR